MSQRNLTIALIASMALNLFAVGGIVGMFVLGQRMHQAHPRMAAQPLWAAGRALPAESRMAYWRSLREGGGAVREQMGEARRARRAAFDSLGQEPFDAEASRARFAEARRLEAEARGAVEGRLVDFAAELSPQDRRALARGFREAGPRPGRAMGMRDGPHPGPPPGDAP